MRTFAIFLSLALLAACATSTEADRRIMKRPPQEDFERLARFLQKTGNNDYLIRNNLSVSWADTESYRVFRFEGLVVFIYPYDWTASNRDISIMVDRDIPGNDFRDHFYQVGTNSEGDKVFLTDPDNNRMNSLSLGFRDFVFSSEKSKILDGYFRSANQGGLGAREQDRRKELALAGVNDIAFSYGPINSEKRIDGFCVFNGDSTEARPVWLRLHNRGMSQLSFFAWGSAGGTPTTTVDEGMFQWEPERGQP